MFNICLKTLARSNNEQTVQLDLSERLPEFIDSPCKLMCSYKVTQERDYYLLTLHIKGQLNIICQRCLATFEMPYDKETVLAVCKTEERATELMNRYESFVSGQDVDLMQLVTDELYISAPDKHEHINDCDKEVISLMGKEE